MRNECNTHNTGLCPAHRHTAPCCTHSSVVSYDACSLLILVCWGLTNGPARALPHHHHHQSGVSMAKAATMGRGSESTELRGRCRGTGLTSEARTASMGAGLSASLLCRLYEMLPYSCSSGQAPSRNWQKSLRIPNHQWFPPLEPNERKMRTRNVK